MGLALVRKLVELLDGEVSVASPPHEGSVFSVSIPLRPAPALRGEAAQLTA